MARLFNPADMCAPQGAYTHGAEVQVGERMVYFSGQVGLSASGELPLDFANQIRNIYSNIETILSDVGMDFGNLVKMTTYMVGRDNLPAMRTLRSDLLGDHKPAHTLLVISGLASPEFLIEVEGFAAAAP